MSSAPSRSNGLRRMLDDAQPHPGNTTARQPVLDSLVVVVDDTPANVQLLERLLRAAGLVNVRGYTDPRLALAACRDARPDLVLLDLHMPHLDGFAFMDALGELAPPTDTFLPVLVLTADATTDVKQRALAAGAKDFLAKPFDSLEVILRVRNLLETRALHGRLEEQNAELRTTVVAQTMAAHAAAAEQRARLDRIEAVLAGRGLAMVFQPIVDVSTGEVVGVEALARFAAEPVRPPDQWFAEAAAVGLGVELELAAVAAALEELDRLEADSFMAVNVSAATAAADRLDQLLATRPGGRLALELTEHARVEDYGALVDGLEESRSRGVRLAVDDTGAGYAGLQHLLRLHPDIVKLDAALTRGIDVDPARRSLATALVSFAQEIGACIIAEGVETAGELAVLRHVGIQWAQGFYLARPAPLNGGPLRVRGWG